MISVQLVLPHVLIINLGIYLRISYLTWIGSSRFGQLPALGLTCRYTLCKMLFRFSVLAPKYAKPAHMYTDIDTEVKNVKFQIWGFDWIDILDVTNCGSVLTTTTGIIIKHDKCILFKL